MVECSASAVDLVLASFGDEAVLGEQTVEAAVVGMEGVGAEAEGHSSIALRLGQDRPVTARSVVVVRCLVLEAALREAQAIADLGEAAVGVNRSLVDDASANGACAAGGSLLFRAPCPHPCRVRAERSPRRRSPGHRR